MDPHVYPDPQVSPLNLAPAAAPTFTGVEELAAPDPSTPAIPKTMYIRVAMSAPMCPSLGSPCAPSLVLKAGTGAPVTLTGTPQAIYKTPGMVLTDYVADAVAQLEANNVYRIDIRFNDISSTATWQLGIGNNDGVAHDFTWVVSSTLAGTAQPWIDVSPASLVYDALTNQVLGQSVQIANKGTAAFTLNALSPALPSALALTPPLPITVNPAATMPLTITYTASSTPGAATTTTASMTISPTDTTVGVSTGHNGQLQVATQTQRLEVVLLLDDSGSMSWDPLGNILPAGSPTSRWAELESGANQFLDLLAHFGASHGKLGIARFPAGDPGNPSTFDIVPPETIPDTAGIAAAQTAVAAVVPNDSTPMGDGLDRVLNPATSYFATDAASVASDRRWLVLMSDGAQNAGTHNPRDFIPSLAGMNVEVFSVAYGVQGHSNVDHALMRDIAAGSLHGGQYRAVDDSGTTATVLAAALRTAIKAGLTGASSPADPPGVFVIGGGEVRRHAVLTRYDGRAAFVLGWNTPDAERLRLELLTPNCERITPENAGKGDFAEVEFRAGSRFQMYLIGPDFLANRANPGQPRHGTWTLVISSPVIIEAARAVDAENYDYDVIVDSALRMELSLDRATYFAGDRIGVSARVTASGRPVIGATVSLASSAPGLAVANWLAGLTVPASALQEAERLLSGHDSTPILVKTLAAQLAGIPFPGGSQQAGHVMTDPAGVGVYRTTVADTSTPEHYTLFVTAAGVTADGVSFQRAGVVETHVLVRPDAAHTLLDVHYRPGGLADIRVIPRDRFGNVVLLELATAGGFGLVARGGTFTGPLLNNLDGSYSRTLRYDPNTVPAVGFEFGGVAVIPARPLAPLPRLHYVDQVVSFEGGVVQAANRHADPRAALGSVAAKPDDQFVSLGAAGRLTVAIGGSVVVATGEDDVTVFVRPDDDLRSYHVEARERTGGEDDGNDDSHGDRGDRGDRGRWVVLGVSSGITQAFGLRRAGIERADEIRITDTSHRARDVAFAPLASPGVSVRGVGVVRTERDKSGNGGDDGGDRGRGENRGDSQ
jgi:Mg-chelatase subunit ChlD